MADLTFCGSDSLSLEKKEIEFLGKLLGAMLYNEIDIASNMLLKEHHDLVIDIGQASRQLWLLSELCYKGD